MHPLAKLPTSRFYRILAAAILAYTVFFFAAETVLVTCGQYSIHHYIWGFVLHMPWWLAGYAFAALFLKITISRAITIALGFLLIIFFALSFIFEFSQKIFDYIFLPLGIVDFLFFFSLLSLKKKPSVRNN